MENIKLEIDPITHDVSLAKEFLKDNKYHFDILQSKRESIDKTLVKDNIGNTIYVSKEINDLNSYDGHEPLIVQKSRQELCERLKNNEKLFAQLEFMIRNIPEEETLANMKLIQQCLLTPDKRHLNTVHELFTLFKEEYPLAVLGLRIIPYDAYYAYTIVAAPNTAAVATLYVQLCRESGILMELDIIEEDMFKQIPSGHLNDRRCTGVVTETADIDSALETFLSSFSKKPWNFNRVLVQENVYDSFKKSLKWKCKDSNLKPDISEDIISMCSEVHQVDKRIFLVDYAGADTTLLNKDGMILVEAFRTVPELLSLLQVQNAFCLSLWCNDLATANSIAYSTNAAFTWINDYCSFEGPAELSQAFYSQIHSVENFNFYPEFKNRSWLDVEQLTKKLENSTGVLPELKKQLKIPYENFKRVTLESNGLSIVLSEIADVVCITLTMWNNLTATEVIKYIAAAAQFKRKIAFFGSLDTEIYTFMNALNLPFTIGRLPSFLSSLYKTKCVWTKFSNKS